MRLVLWSLLRLDPHELIVRNIALIGEGNTLNSLFLGTQSSIVAGGSLWRYAPVIIDLQS